jgi:branched-subunit amino acid aminotransferase/4-amino-4-deoxychorismate lyase
MGFEAPIDQETLAQGISDLVAILGPDIFVGPDGTIGRAYIRPSVVPGMGPQGVSPSPLLEIDAAVEAFHWPFYFPPEAAERAYQGSGLVVIAKPHQRLEPITGKHATNYGHAAAIGKEAQRLGGDEALFFAPYSIGADGERQLELLSSYKGDSEGLREAMGRVALADGPGEEILAVTKDGTLLIPPMDVNRLGGTTAAYVRDHLAPALGVATEERAFNLAQVRDGEIIGLFFAGNASRLAAIGEVRLHDAAGNPLDKIVVGVPDEVRALIDQYEAEVRGMIPPSDNSLLVPVDLVGGQDARRRLDSIYAHWMN